MPKYIFSLQWFNINICFKFNYSQKETFALSLMVVKNSMFNGNLNFEKYPGDFGEPSLFYVFYCISCLIQYIKMSHSVQNAKISNLYLFNFCLTSATKDKSKLHL